MNNLKKVLCLIMSMAMLFSVMVMGAGAAKTFPDQKDIQNTEAVNMAVALNIIQGRDTGNFDPTGNITRAEMAKMICILWNGGNEPKLSEATGEATYSDINGHWAEKYIEYCSALNFIAGMGDGTFNPWGNVTGTEAAKMLLVALGYDPAYEGFNGLNWSTQIDVRASGKNLYDDMTNDFKPGNKLTRDNAAQMVWNALQAYTVSYDTNTQMVNGQWTTVKTLKDKSDVNNNVAFFITLLYDRYDKAQQIDAVLNSFTYDSNKEEWTYNFVTRDDFDTIEANGKNVSGSFTSEQDFTYLYKQNVKVVFNVTSSNKVDKFYGAFADESVILAEGVVGDLDDVKSNDKNFTIGSTSYKLDKSTKETLVFYFVNGNNSVVGDKQTDGSYKNITEQYIFELQDFYDNSVNTQPYKMKAVDNDENGKVDFLVVYPFAVAQVEYAGSKSFTIDYKSTATAASDESSNFGLKANLLTGSIKFEDVTAYDGVKDDDFVVYTPEKYSAIEEDTFVKVDTILKGDVKSTRDDKISVDGTWYNVLTGLYKDNNTDKDLVVSAGGSIKNAPVVNGYIFDANGTGSVSLDDYALVIGYNIPSGNNSIDNYQVKLLLSDGNKKVVDVDDDDYDSSTTAGVPNSPIISKGSEKSVLAAQLKDLYDDEVATLVTFETNSDDEYQLTIADTAADTGDKAEDAGFDAILNSSKGFTGSSETKAKYIDGASIDSDAVIFLNDKGTYKTIKGDKLKSLSKSGLTVLAAYADEDNDTGYNTVKMAYVSSADKTVSTADYEYGLVTQKVQSTKDNTTNTYTYTLFNGGKDPIDVPTKNRNITNADKVQKGDLIAYTLNDDGKIDEVHILSSTGDILDSNGNVKSGYVDGATAITGYDGTYLSTEATSEYGSSNSIDGDTGRPAYDRVEVTKDTVIIYINAADVEGVDGSKIKNANKDKDDVYIKNAVIWSSDNDEADVVFIDVNNNDIYCSQS